MRFGIIALTVIGCALLALPADAESPWTRNDYSASYYTLVLIDGDLVPGTVHYTTSIWTRNDGDRMQTKAHGFQTFLSDDGSIEGRTVWNWSFRWRPGAARTYTYAGHIHYFRQGEGLIHTVKLKYHYTFNANGELVSITG